MLTTRPPKPLNSYDSCCYIDSNRFDGNGHQISSHQLWFIATDHMRKYHCSSVVLNCTGCFVMFSMITNTYNKKTKGPTLMELYTATGKLKKFFF
jgi:hypothetical protein